jgi:predicted MFS family arabinose efflux permease
LIAPKSVFGKSGSGGAADMVPMDRDNQIWLIFIVACGCAIGTLTFGPRSAMGLFLIPMTDANGWSREAFAFAIALQNLVWGAVQPFAGGFADRFGTWRVLSLGTLAYVLGLVLMSQATDPLELHFTAGVLLGVGIASSAFFLVLAAFARMVPEEKRGLVFGLGTAASSAGQLVFAPLGQAWIETYGFETALLLIAGLVAIVPLLAIPLRGKPETPPAIAGQKDQSVKDALVEAFGNRSYILLVLGFFVCGYHVAFITVHLPSYIRDICGPTPLAAYSIAIIGAFNIIGAISAGTLMGRWPKRYILSSIYLGRVVVISAFVLMPVSEASIIVFSAAMGILWLSTVPPTQGLVAVFFGTRYMAMLFGIAFFSHQVGSFLGIWLGGKIYDATGNYDLMWFSSIVAGLLAALAHWPIKERAVARLQPA